MTTRTYIFVMATLIVCAAIGSYAAYEIGETTIDIIERLLVFIPAVSMFTLLWVKRQRQISLPK